MSYSAALHRVRVEISCAAAWKDENPPLDLVTRAKNKLETMKNDGEIAFYYVFESRLIDVWKAIHQLPRSEENRKIIFTLAAGTPALPGIKVERSSGDKVMATLSIDASKEIVSQWRWEWFKIFVLRQLREAGLKDVPNYAQIFAAFARARIGEKVQGFPVGTLLQLAQTGQASRAFSVVANRQRMEVGVVVRHLSAMNTQQSLEAMLALVGQAVQQLTSDEVEYNVLKKDFVAALQSAIDGQEGLGIDTPVALLAAIGHKRQTAGKGLATKSAAATQAAAPTTTPPPQTTATAPQAPAMPSYAGAGKISFDISRDKMEATIAGFHSRYYEDPGFQVSAEWFEQELKRCGILVGTAEDILKGINEAIARKQDLNGLLAARGILPRGGKGAFLHPSFRDGSMKADAAGQQLDMREMQQRTTVQAGQLIAEIRFEKPAVRGKNVLGQPLPLLADDNLTITIGEGIQQREQGKFYAITGGLPVIEGGSISLSKVLVHEGDVNLRTGNIRFAGPVEIKGSIESGAVVQTSGDLIVHGTIQGATVTVGGNLQVFAGITTGTTGRVKVRGNVTAEFIENTTLLCGGDLTVTKALIGSRVIVGGKLNIPGTGVIAGGMISCRETVATHNLGFPNGAVTEMNIGVDWRIAQRVEVRTRRLERMQAKLLEDRSALRELSQKKAAQLTQKHKDMKEELQERLTRGRAIVEKCEAKLAEATAKMSYNPEAKVIVRGQLETNVHVTIGGQKVPVTNALASVAILSKRRGGSYIVALDEEKDNAAPAA